MSMKSLVFFILILFGKVIPVIDTVPETHHLLSAELCGYSDGPVSTQRGGGAAAAHSGSYKGNLMYVCAHLVVRAPYILSCLITLFNPIAPPRGRGKPYSFNKSAEDQFEGNLPQQQKHHKGVQHKCYTLNS